MPKQLLVDRQESFIGGLNTSADESRLREDEMRAAKNVRLNEFGGALKRLGSKRIHASAIGSGNPIKGGFYWPFEEEILAVSNGTLYTASYAIPTTFTSQTGALSTSAFPSFAAFHDGTDEVVYIADGGLLNKWDGTTLTVNMGGTPNVSQLAVHNLRLFGCGDIDNPYRLYWSGLGDGDTLGDTANGGGFADIRTFGHSPLVGILAVGESLLIFHRDGISRFTGWSQDDIDIDSGTRGVSNDVGSISPRSLVSVENTGFFMSDRGIYAVTEGGVEPIAVKIEESIRQLSQEDFDEIFAVHNKAFREVWFFFPGTGAYVFNYRIKQWTGPWDTVFSTVESLWSALDTDGNPIVLSGGTNGFVRHMDLTGVYKDDVLSDGSGGSDVVMVIQCHRMFFGYQIIDKSMRYIFVTFNPRGDSSGYVTWTTGPITGIRDLPDVDIGAIWGAFTWGSFLWGSRGSAVGRVQAWGTGFYVDISIVDDTDSNPVYSRVEAHAFGLAARFS